MYLVPAQNLTRLAVVRLLFVHLLPTVGIEIDMHRSFTLVPLSQCFGEDCLCPFEQIKISPPSSRLRAGFIALPQLVMDSLTLSEIAVPR